MENRGAFAWRQTGQFEFLERGGGHSRNLLPMLDDSRRKTPRLRFATARQARFADFPVGGVVLELERKEFERKLVKISEGRVTRVPILAFQVRASYNSALRVNRLAQARGKV
jgi:hypothetical protein